MHGLCWRISFKIVERNFECIKRDLPPAVLINSLRFEQRELACDMLFLAIKSCMLQIHIDDNYKNVALIVHDSTACDKKDCKIG